MPSKEHRRGFSFGSKSSKSHRSSASGNPPSLNHLPLAESVEEKARRNLRSKADPTIAMSELQPSEYLPSFYCTAMEC